MRVTSSFPGVSGLLAGVLLLGAAPALAQRGAPPEDAPVRAPPGSLTKRIAEQQKQAVIDADKAAKAEAAAIADPSNMLNLDLSTGGRVVVQLRPDKAPNSVERIKTLVGRHFYDGLVFHRVIEGFMAQGGDPKGDGSGGSELPDVKAEFNDMPHVRGVMSMARAESKDSANSQFFIMLAPLLTLDGKYSPIGRVVSGMAYVDAIERGEPPANPSRIVRATLGRDVPAFAVSTPAASGAAAAAAGAASTQASDAKVAASEAEAAATRGDRRTAAERTRAAKVSAQGAARAANDAAQAADAANRAAEDQVLREGGFPRGKTPKN